MIRLIHTAPIMKVNELMMEKQSISFDKVEYTVCGSTVNPHLKLFHFTFLRYYVVNKMRTLINLKSTIICFVIT